jgi:patatin-like phospholipase/acyl hydrolase
MKRILSIDGGGIRGLIPALILGELERRTNRPIAKSFDLIAGTSTGGILALGLTRKAADGSARFSAAQLAELYESRGKDIFARSLWRGVASLKGALDERYPAAGLEQVLRDYFGNEALGASLTRTLIPSYDIERRRPLFFKSWRDEHAGVLAAEVARATSAAPTYFEPARVTVEGAVRTLVDGGVFINSPTVSAYAEARCLFPDEKDFFVLSLGTGELVRPIPYADAKDWGAVGWVIPLLTCMFDGVADAADYQMQSLLGDRYVRLQKDLAIASDDMDNATTGNLENLKTEARTLLEGSQPQINRIVEALAL